MITFQDGRANGTGQVIYSYLKSEKNKITKECDLWCMVSSHRWYSRFLTPPAKDTRI